MTGEYDSGDTRPRNCGVKGAEKCCSRFFVQTVGGLVQKKNHRMPEQGPHQQEQAELALQSVNTKLSAGMSVQAAPL